MTFIAITAGMLVKVLQVSILNFSRRDLLYIGLALVAGLFFAVRLAEGYEPGGLLNPWYGLPIGFAAVVAFAFKDRLLPPITEGTLFAYGLVGCYLFSKDFFTSSEVSIFNSIVFVAMCCYVGLSLLIIFYNRVVSKGGQTLLMTLFISMSVYIGYTLAVYAFTLEVSYFEAAVIGFCYLPLVANVLYLLYFLPVPLSKSESFTERFDNIKRHSVDLEKKFVSVDVTRLQILGIVALFSLLVLVDWLSPLSEAALVALVLALETLINRVPAISAFTPALVSEKL